MSLIEQTLSKMRSEFSEILATNIAKSTKHYSDSRALQDTTDLIWEDTAFVGITEDSDIENIITNAGFYSDLAWTKGAGWSIPTTGYAQCDGTQAGATTLKQTGIITAYNLYRIKILFSKDEGEMFISFDGSIDNQTSNVDQSPFDDVLRAYSDSDFVINGDKDLRVYISNVKVQQVDPVDKTKYDAVAYCPYDYDVDVRDYLEVDDIFYLVYKIESNLDHKKVFCLHL